MKAIVFSDLHCGIYKDHPSLGNRFETSSRILLEVLNMDCDLFIFCGDLYDVGKKPPAEVVNQITDIFSTLNKPFIAISGNHDISHDYMNGNKGITLLSHLDTAFKNFHLIDNSFYVHKDYTIFGIPYHPDAKDVLERLKSLPVQSTRKNILLTHQNYPGYIGGQEYSAADIKPFKFVFNGHIHSYIQFAPNGYNIGNPFHRDLGDIDDDKGYLILDGDNITRHLFEYPRVERVMTPVKTIITNKVKVEFKTPSQILGEYCNDQPLLELGLSYL